MFLYLTFAWNIFFFKVSSMCNMGLKGMTPRSRITHATNWASQEPLEHIFPLHFQSECMSRSEASYMQYTDGSYSFIHSIPFSSVTLCLLIGALRSFAFKVIIGSYVLTPILLFSDCFCTSFTLFPCDFYLSTLVLCLDSFLFFVYKFFLVITMRLIYSVLHI